MQSASVEVPIYEGIGVKQILLGIILCLAGMVAKGSVLYPGKAYDVYHEPVGAEYSPSWSTDNPTLHLSSVGFLCHVTAQAYFGGTATVTCTYKDRIGTSTYTRTKKWSFTCSDTKISISPTSKRIKTGDSFQINCSYDQTTYFSPSVQYTGYDSKVVSISQSGLVTAVGEGSTQIYVKSNIGTNSAICTVDVSKNSSGGSNAANSAYYDWDSSNTRVITVTEPGTLPDHITDSQKYNIKDLAVIGPINGYDLRLLREMCGMNENNSPTNGKLEVLDLKEAIFVGGGPWYLYRSMYYYTSDFPGMPDYSFAWMSNLKRIRFPKYCRDLTNESTLQCYSLEHISIPPGVVSLDGHSLRGGGAWQKIVPMTTLSLPSSMVNFDADIYEYDNLTDIYCYAVTPPVIKYPSSFKSQTNITQGTLYVPRGCAQSYWRAEGWRSFKNIKETLDVCHTLYFRVGANGSVKYNDQKISQLYPVFYAGWQAFEIPESETVEIEILPDEGYSVESVTLDGVTMGLPSSDNKLSLGKISKHAECFVTFGKKAYVDDAIMELDGGIQIYTLQGVFVGSFNSEDEVSDLPRGLYVAKVGKSAKKIMIH